MAFRLKFPNCLNDEELIEIKNKKTHYDIEKEEAIARGEYWSDRR